MSSAAAAPRPTMIAPTVSAATNPSTNALGVALPRRPENTAARTAIPSTPPISRIALVAPDALAGSSGRTALITTFATGATNDAVLMPARNSAGSSCA